MYIFFGVPYGTEIETRYDVTFSTTTVKAMASRNNNYN